MKVLIIDDERSIRNTLKEILEFEGHEVVTAEDGKQGVDKALDMQEEAAFLAVVVKLDVIDTYNLIRIMLEDAIVVVGFRPFKGCLGATTNNDCFNIKLVLQFGLPLFAKVRRAKNSNKHKAKGARDNANAAWTIWTAQL